MSNRNRSAESPPTRSLESRGYSQPTHVGESIGIRPDRQGTDQRHELTNIAAARLCGRWSGDLMGLLLALQF